ncbi:MAG: hypothetical protein ACM3L6_02815 [Deltaproteobacteria bacterium]
MARALVVIAVGLAGTGLAQAGIRIDSPKVRVSIPAGGHQSGEITVENTGTEPISVRIYMEDWVFSDQTGGKTFFPKGTRKNSCADWINFYPADLELAAGGSQKVRYTVSVPEGVQGGHFSVLFFETGGGTIEKPNEAGDMVTVKVFNRLGALFYIEPQGTIDRRGAVTSMEVSERLNDLVVTADFANVGNTDIIAHATLNVFDAEGYVIGRGGFEDTYTLPGDKATMTGVASSVNLKPGAYDLVVTVEYEQGGVLTKEASFTYGADHTLSPLTLKE